MKSPILCVILPSILLAGCLTTTQVGGSTAKAGEKESLGSVVVESDHVGHVTLSPSACVAGARQFFLGSDFVDDDAGITVRLVVDPLKQPAVRVFSTAAPFDKSFVFHRPDCRSFHFSLDSTGFRINEIEDYRVTLEVDCASPGGESVKGRLSATHCH